MGGAFSNGNCFDNPAIEDSKPTPQPTPAITEVDRAVLDLKNSRDRLHRYRQKLDKDQDKLLTRAKQYRTTENNTKAALTLLRLRKHKLKEAENVENQLLTVLQMVDTIQSKENEKDVLAAMKTGKEALQKLHDEMSVDDVLDLMEDVKEQNEVQEQIDDILREGVVQLSVEDEDEIERDLAEMEKDILGGEEDEEKKGEEDVLPEVPTKPLPEVSEGEGKKKVEEESRPEPVAVMAS